MQSLQLQIAKCKFQIANFFLFAFLLLFAFLTPSRAVDTLDVKTTVNGAWTVYKHSEFTSGFFGICRTSDGRVWGSRGICFDGERWVQYTAEDGVPSETMGLPVEMADGTLWTYGLHQGKNVVVRYEGQEWELMDAEGVGENQPRMLGAVDASGNIWWLGRNTSLQAGARSRRQGGDGVLRFNPADGTWKNFRHEDGLSHNRVYDVQTGGDGSIWVTTLMDISRFDGRQWTTYTRADGVGTPKLYGILPARDGRVWATNGIPGGVSVFDGNSWEYLTWHTGMPVKRVRRVSETSDGAIWFGTNPDDLATVGASGVLRYKDGMWLRITRADGLPGDVALQAVEAADGSLFMPILNAGIARYRPDFSALATVSGRVTGLDGIPAVGVGIHVTDASGVVRAGTRTDSDGRYRAQVFPGAYQVSVILGKGVQPIDIVARAGREIRSVDFAPRRVGLGREVAAESGTAVAAGKGKGLWRTYDVQDGLATGSVLAIAQDREGHMWFGGNGGGLSRYDGSSFRTFTTEDGLLHNGVQAVFEDEDGDLWIGTEGGVSLFREGAFVTSPIADSLSNRNVCTIFQDRDRVFWFGTRGNGAMRYDGQALTMLTETEGLAGNTVLAIAQDRFGTMWFGTTSGLSHFNSGRNGLVTMTTQEGLLHNRIEWITEDRAGSLWAATWGGIVQYGGRASRHFTVKDGLGSNLAISVIQDRADNMWFGMFGGGAVRYDGATIERFTLTDGLRGNDVVRVFQDREGILWFGHYGGGVSRFDGETFAAFSEDDGLAGALVHTTYCDREGHLWFGTSRGVSRYDGKTFTSYTSEDGLGDNDVRAIFQDRADNMWFGTVNGGVSRYDGQTFFTLNAEDGFISNTVGAIAQDKNGHMWFGGDATYRYDGERLFHYDMNDGMAAGSENAIFIDHRGDLWFGGLAGLSHYDGRTFTRITKEQGLVANDVRAIFQDREGHFWFGTGGGVSRYALDQPDTSWASFTREDGLADNNVTSITQGQDGHLWFGTGGGASRYDGQAFQTLLQKDGLAGDAVNDIALDQNGDVWFGTLTGVSRYRQPEPSSPLIRIDAVVADRRREGVSVVSIPSGVRTVAFEFHGANFKTRPEAMVYRYRLKGYDDDWKTTRNTRVEYQDLPRGGFAFEVQAVDRDLVYSDLASVSLNVHLPYERVGLWSALVVAVGLLIAQGARIVRRDRRLNEANVQLEESNLAMSHANKELFQLNQELQREHALEHIRREVQSMEKAADFHPVLSLLAQDLKAVGLSFDSCAIDVLSEPVDNPTMDHFEEHGIDSTSYTIDPEGRVDEQSFRLTAPFPPVVAETLMRFADGKPWQGKSDTVAIVEVPAANYGRLRLTSSDRSDFSEAEIETLRDFAAAIALGYARYLDIRTIQEQTERKSAFLASMSHELRTPMNAVKGFANLVRRREKGLSDRGRENLEKVDQASDHLLAMINDLLDLSKIEAGRMDVQAAPFDVRKLVNYCASTVSPLVQEGVELRAEVDEDVGEAHTDEARLRQMLINLLSNAVKFTEEGEVRVHCKMQNENFKVQNGEAGAPGSVEMLEIAVSDTGKGISADELPTIFDEYRQVKGSESVVQKGTGLGLSITRKFAALLGGTLGVKSEAGKGSVFTVRIPSTYEDPC